MSKKTTTDWIHDALCVLALLAALVVGHWGSDCDGKCIEPREPREQVETVEFATCDSADTNCARVSAEVAR